jgi:hypothetical protein
MDRPDKDRRSGAAAFGLALLVATASLGGILLPTTYARESPGWATQAVGQDWVDLLVAVPWLVLAGVGTSRGSRPAALLLAGGILYTLYEFLIYAFAVHFNRLFLVYCATLGLSFFSVVRLIPRLLGERQNVRPDRRLPIRSAAGVLLAIGFLFGALWLGEIIPALRRGTAPRAVMEAGLFTNPVHVVDLAVVLPAHILVAVWLLQRRPSGAVWAPILLSFGVLMAISIGGMMVVSRLRGFDVNLTVAAGMAMVAVVGVLVLLSFLRCIR